MADAEVKLNFTVQVEQARAGIAEIAAAMEKLAGKGGVMSPGEASLLNQMQGQLAAYKARLDELTAAYDRVRASSGGMSRQALAQIKELQEEVARLTKTQDDLLKKIVDLQVANNELKGATAGVSTETAKAGRDGVRVVRSMRGVIANFIRDLMRGKLAVRELGLALKGLAYSTVVLGAIQLAMEGIGLVWEKIKGVFSTSEEEMQAAQEAAEKAKDALDDAHRAAVEAGKEYQALKDKFDNDKSAEILKANIGSVAELFRRQREEQEKTLGLMQIQAELEARAIKDRAERESHEIRLQELELKRKKLMEEISAEEYENQMADLGMRARGAMRRGRVDAAAASVRELEAQRRDLARRLADASAARGEAAAAQSGRVSDNDLALLFKELQYAQARLAEANQQKATAIRTSDGTLGEDYNQALRDTKEWGERVRQLELYYEKQKGLNAGYAEGAEFIKQQDKLMGELSRKADDVGKKLATAKRRLKETEEDTFLEALRDEEMGDAERSVRKAGAEAERREAERKESEKERARREKLEGQVAGLVERARRAVEETPGDARDDRKAFEAIGNFLDKNAAAIREYGVNVKSLLDVTRQLKLLYDGAEAERKRVAAEIADLRRQVNLNQKAIRK